MQTECSKNNSAEAVISNPAGGGVSSINGDKGTLRSCRTPAMISVCSR